MINYTATYTDHYQLTMAQIYYLQGKSEQRAVFDYFFRKNPFGGGYALFAGLDDFLQSLDNFCFDARELDFLAVEGFNHEFLTYLKTFRFRGTVYSCPEGELVFPNAPIVRIEASLLEAQLIETLLLNILNFQTLIATKASRMREAAGPRTLLDLGLRRAQGPGGYYASRAAIIGGFDASSNLRAGLDYKLPTTGTMAHAFIQSYENELRAFQAFADTWPTNCVLLVDTYDTLKSGLPNAIKIAKALEAKGHRLKAVRLDSGDLAYLAKKTRELLDAADLNYVKIAVSNQLDEVLIKSLLLQQAPIDIFGVGTNLVIGAPDGALDGVYKLAEINNKPCIKVSENAVKTTLPGRKQVYRSIDKSGYFAGADTICLLNELAAEIMHHPFEAAVSVTLTPYQKEPLLMKVMEKGKRLFAAKTIKEISHYAASRLAMLPVEYKRFDNPHRYKVGLSPQLKTLRDQLIAEYKKQF